MPELPEVENVRRQLECQLELPRRLVAAEFYRRDLRFPIPSVLKRELAKGLELGPLRGVERRAKYLLFQFDSGYLLSHLGMTGWWRRVIPGEARILHDHISLRFENGAEFVFNDPRRFGYVDWVANLESHKLLRHLGPEPLGELFTAEHLFKTTRSRRTKVKTFIMDQKHVVGVGNIYASEALFHAGIRPTRMAARLSLDECNRLVVAIRDVLKNAIAHGGSTIRDFKGTEGHGGQFQNQLFVYDRSGDPCRKCGHKIVSKTIGSRSTYWCPRCQ